MTRKAAVRQSEVLANIRASPVLASVLGILAAAVGFGVVGFSCAETQTAVEAWEREVAAGAATFIVTTSGEIPMAASGCDALNSISGVVGAGGILGRTTAWLAQDPTTPIAILDVTPRFPAATWATLPSAGPMSVVVPSETAEQYGWTQGTNITYRMSGPDAPHDWQSVEVDVVPEGRNRVDGINDAVMFVAPPSGAVQSCIVAADPAVAKPVRSAVSGVLGPGYVLKDFLEQSAIRRSPQELMDSRIGVWLSIAGAGFLVLVAVATWIGRRGEFALYRALGMGDDDIRAMLTLETLLIFATPVSAGSVFAIAFHAVVPLEAVKAELAAYLLVVFGLALAPLVGSFVLLRASAIDTIKGR